MALVPQRKSLKISILSSSYWVISFHVLSLKNLLTDSVRTTYIYIINNVSSEGDRKAYYETYENTKKTNDQLMKDLKEENSQLRKEIANLQREMQNKGGLSGDQSEVEEELKKVSLNYV
jgi:DNA-binding transcriptional regulator GbsR (MarR family)